MTERKIATPFLAMVVVTMCGSNLACAGIITFQQGVGGYTDVLDANISTDFSGTNSAGSLMGVFLATANGREDQALVRFNNIFGNGIGQIPLTASVTSATLTLTLTGQTFDTSIGTSALHRLSKDWTTSNDWSSSFWGGNGIQNDGTEAIVAADDTGTWLVSGGSADFDVSSSLQAWQAGSGNFGWYLRDQSDSNDRAFISTSEFGITASRPLLSVAFATAVPEPSTLVLLAIAAFGMGSYGWRRKR